MVKRLTFVPEPEVAELLERVATVTGVSKVRLISWGIIKLAREIENLPTVGTELLALKGKKPVFVVIDKSYPAEFVQELISNLEKSGQLEKFYQKWKSVKENA